MKPYTYNKIVIPHDGSPFASGVIPYITPLAVANNASIYLLHVLNTVTQDYTLVNTANTEMYPNYGTTMTNLQTMQSIQNMQKRQVIKEFKHIKSVLESYNLSKISTHFLEGIETEMILEFAKAKHCNLIAMSSYGRGGLNRMVLGSVADYVIRHAPCPVFIAHPHLE